MRANLLELHREFLPSPDKEESLDAVSFAASVNGWVFQKKGEDKPTVNFNWTANLSVRIQNVTVRLHSNEGDDNLTHMEAKLVLLRDTIVEFIEEVDGRLKDPEKKPRHIHKRKWLNPEKLPDNYTGYVSYKVEKGGFGRIFIADCHRSIDIQIFIYRPNKKAQKTFPDIVKENNEYANKQVDELKGLVLAVTRSIDHINKLRERFDAKELEAKVLEDHEARKPANG
jgi:hypothetical protein